MIESGSLRSFIVKDYARDYTISAKFLIHTLYRSLSMKISFLFFTLTIAVSLTAMQKFRNSDSDVKPISEYQLLKDTKEPRFSHECFKAYTKFKALTQLCETHGSDWKKEECVARYHAEFLTECRFEANREQVHRNLHQHFNKQ